ncbi:MAG: LacI family DNA-binding transcriptional regulator [Oscillospiraceae bacterium]|nr:LacI family DNA-binding transcriptional regulator [Oscillospiraceae bacterium]
MTIKDLAAQTGYSVGTISRVLNNQPNVSEKARAAILAAAAESGFQLNTNAKQLKQQHSNCVVVVVKGTSNEFFSGLVESIQARMAQTPYPLIVDYIDEDSNEVLRALQLCREKKPLGLLFLGANRQNLQADFGKIGLPCVVVTNSAADLEFPNLSSVASDDRQATREAIDALAGLGHRKFAIIGGEHRISGTAGQRYRGCLEAFQANGIAFDEELDYEAVRFSYDGGYQAAERLLARNRGFTALFAMADVMAIGAIRALTDHGLRVPEDVSVMGFDGLKIGDYTVPKLATVRQDVDALAEESIRILQENITQLRPPRHKTVPVSLELKESAKFVK